MTPPSSSPSILNLSQKTQIPTKRRAVRFSPKSILYCFPKTREEIFWYTHEDELRFKLQAKEDMITCLRMKIKSGSISDHNMCPIGLEMQLISKGFSKKRRLTKELVWLAVRVEQERPIEYDNDYDKQKRVAAASMKHSEWSRAQAQTLGTYQAKSTEY